MWLCGGELLEVPCSRIAHTFRWYNPYRFLDNTDYVAKNFVRVAEVWMDDWKQYLYKTNPERYANVDPGDLTKQKEIRKQLNCKPFDYYIHYIAPEMLVFFSIPRDDDFAFGTLYIKNENDSLCLTDNRVSGGNCKLDKCDKSKITPHRSQYFHYTEQRGIEHERAEMCLEKRKFKTLEGYTYKKNKWKYNFETSQIFHESGKYCMSIMNTKKTLELVKCDVNSENQRFFFGYVNKTMLKIHKTN